MWRKARHSLGIPGQPVTMPDEKAEAVATCTARGQEDAPAAPRHAGTPAPPADVVVTLHYRPADSGG